MIQFEKPYHTLKTFAELSSLSQLDLSKTKSTAPRLDPKHFSCDGYSDLRTLAESLDTTSQNQIKMHPNREIPVQSSNHMSEQLVEEAPWECRVEILLG